MSENPTVSLKELQSLIESSNTRTPVQKWNPSREGVIDICIRKDGSWAYQGGAIERIELVKLFASVLRLDTDGYCLVTPVEKLLIEVEDAPFVVISMDIKRLKEGEQVIVMQTNAGEQFCLDGDHALDIEYSDTGEPRPYIHIKYGLRARLLRHLFYELVELGEVHGNRLFVRSAHQLFDLGAING